jgi:hypothetical protein
MLERWWLKVYCRLSQGRLSINDKNERARRPKRIGSIVYSKLERDYEVNQTEDQTRRQEMFQRKYASVYIYINKDSKRDRKKFGRKMVL